MDIYEFEGDIEEYRLAILEVLTELQNKFGIPVSEEEICEPLWDIVAELDRTILRIKCGRRMIKINKQKKQEYKKYPATLKMMEDISRLL